MNSPWRVRKGFSSYHDELFRERREHLEIYLEETWAIPDHDDVINDFEENPYAGLIIVGDYINNRDDPDINRQKLINLIKKPETGVILVSGSKGSGKSYFAFDMIESLAEYYHPVWVGPPIKLPGWIGYAADINKLQKDDLAIIDEAQNIANSRRAMSGSNIDVATKLGTLRHADIKVVFISQSTKRIDVSIVEFADMHVKKEYSAVYGQKTERFDVDIFDKYLSNGMQEWNFIRSSTFMGMVLGRHLDWYTDEIGKSYSLFKNKKIANEFLSSMIDNEIHPNSIRNEMAVRGCVKSMKEWKKIIGNFEQFGTLGAVANMELMKEAGVRNPGGHRAKA